MRGSCRRAKLLEGGDRLLERMRSAPMQKIAIQPVGLEPLERPLAGGDRPVPRSICGSTLETRNTSSRRPAIASPTSLGSRHRRTSPPCRYGSCRDRGRAATQRSLSRGRRARCTRCPARLRESASPTLPNRLLPQALLSIAFNELAISQIKNADIGDKIVPIAASVVFRHPAADHRSPKTCTRDQFSGRTAEPGSVITPDTKP